MEKLLHYIWKHKILPLHQLFTTDGSRVEIINPGMHNQNAGPDFLNAKIKIDGTLWAGNIEIHTLSSDWMRHRHNENPAYDNVILHVVDTPDCDVYNSLGKQIPQLQLNIPDYVRANFNELQNSDRTPRCADIIPSLPQIMVHSWMNSLLAERMEKRTEEIKARNARCTNDWETTLFVTLSRNFGFGLNGDTFEAWAKTMPISAINKHRDNLMQIEAMFFGQAGLLDSNSSKGNDGEDEYVRQLKNEYRFLKNKFSLTPIDPTMWKFLRLRPQNFPHIRIAQLANLIYSKRLNMSAIVEAADLKEMSKLLDTHVSEYWQTHYTFASAHQRKNEKHLSDSSKRLLIINTLCPMLFAYGKYKNDESLCEKSLNAMQEVKPEDNHITRAWKACGVTAESAADSQALIQLEQNYCSTHNCLRCRFGYEFIRQNPNVFREKQE